MGVHGFGGGGGCAQAGFVRLSPDLGPGCEIPKSTEAEMEGKHVFMVVESVRGGKVSIGEVLVPVKGTGIFQRVVR